MHHENNLKKATVNDFLGTVVDETIGIAPSYGSRCVLRTIAFSSSSQVLLIRLSSRESAKSHKAQKNSVAVNRSLLEAILCHVDSTKYTLKMDKLSMALHLDLGLHLTNGVDLLSVYVKGDRYSVAALRSALGGETTLNKAEVSTLFKDDEMGSDIRATAMQAWVACNAGRLPHMLERFVSLPRINSQNMNLEVSQIELSFLFAERFYQHLTVLAKTVRDADRLVALKPTKVKNDVKAQFTYKQGKVTVDSTRFRTRVMPTAGHQVCIRLQLE